MVPLHHRVLTEPWHDEQCYDMVPSGMIDVWAFVPNLTPPIRPSEGWSLPNMSRAVNQVNGKPATDTPYYIRTYHWCFYCHNSNSPLNYNGMIATNFCTCHNSTAVVACAKVCYDMMARNRIAAKWICDPIWIAGEKSSLQWASGSLCTHVKNKLELNQGAVFPIPTRYHWLNNGAIITQSALRKKISQTIQTRLPTRARYEEFFVI